MVKLNGQISAAPSLCIWSIINSSMNFARQNSLIFTNFIYHYLYHFFFLRAHTHTQTHRLCLGSDMAPAAAIFPGTTLCLSLLQLSQHPFELLLLGELIVLVSTQPKRAHTHACTPARTQQQKKTAEQNAPFISPITAWLVSSPIVLHRVQSQFVHFWLFIPTAKR